MLDRMRLFVVGFVVIAATGLVGMAAARQSPGPDDTACLVNVKQVGTALMMYIQDYDEVLPPMKSMAGAQKVLIPYIKSNSVFTCPVTNKPYKNNPVVGSKKLGDFVEP